MIKAKKLVPGDKVATISLSWGGAGELPQRYAIGKQRLESQFGLEVVETKHALKSAEWIYQNPEARAQDLMEALSNSSIKAIFSNIGGDDSVRTLPFLDLEVIRKNPKIFMGFSDTTISHFCFYKAGVTSFYGTSVLVGFAENNGMHAYQIEDIEKSLFSTQSRGIIPPNLAGWTSEMLDWGKVENQKITRKLEKTRGWQFLQGKGTAQGELLGGCVESLETLKDTDFWVKPGDWQGKTMFLETSEYKLDPEYFTWIMRNYAASGILKNIKGLIFGRPYDDQYWQAYDEVLLKVIREEEGLDQLPIISGMDFGHTCPVFSLPYGVKAEINCDTKTFALLESGATE